jgi:hypothetical protein
VSIATGKRTRTASLELSLETGSMPQLGHISLDQKEKNILFKDVLKIN